MRCDEYEILISAYADGELNGQAKVDVEIHIKECDRCKHLYEETVDLQRDLTDTLTHCLAVPDLVSAVNAQVQSKPGFRFTWAWVAAATIAVITICTYAFLQPPVGTKPAKRTAAFTPSRTVKHQKPRSAVHEQQPKTAQDKPIEDMPLPNPKILAKSINKPALPPVHTQKQIIQPPMKTPNISADAAEITVEYSDGTNAAGRTADLAAIPKIPIVGPGQKVVAETETITENGMPTQRMCYRIVESDTANTPEKPDKGE